MDGPSWLVAQSPFIGRFNSGWRSQPEWIARRSRRCIPAPSRIAQHESGLEDADWTSAFREDCNTSRLLSIVWPEGLQASRLARVFPKGIFSRLSAPPEISPLPHKAWLPVSHGPSHESRTVLA